MQEGQTEYISFDTMLEEIGVPDDVRRQMNARTEEMPQDRVTDKPGQDLAKHRVRVSFDFDVTCNSEPVARLSYDEGGTMDMALLKSFLVADKGKLLDMMVDAIGMKLGMHGCETFMHEFLAQVNVESKELFGPAIEALEGDEGVYWREICDEPDTEPGWDDYITVCTEGLFGCFSAEFVKSSYETIYEENLPSKDAPSIWDMVGLLKDDAQ